LQQPTKGKKTFGRAKRQITDDSVYKNGAKKADN